MEGVKKAIIKKKQIFTKEMGYKHILYMHLGKNRLMTFIYQNEPTLPIHDNITSF